MFADLDSFFALFTMMKLNQEAGEHDDTEPISGVEDLDADDLDVGADGDSDDSI